MFNMMLGTIKQVCSKNILKTSAISVVHFQNFSHPAESKTVHSKFKSVDIPRISLDEFLWKGLDKWHDKTALECAETGRSYLYSDVYKKSKAIANFLQKLSGIKPGDSVAIVLPNVPEYPIVLLAAVQAGLQVTTVNPIYTIDEIARQLLDSDAKLIFTLSELWPSVNQAAAKASSLNKIDIVTINHEQNQSIPTGAISFKEIAEGNHRIQIGVSRSFDDVIILPYSSGTTGLPKGVQLSTKNIVSILHLLNTPEMKLQRNAERSFQDVIPAVLPMYHIFGMVVVCLNLLSSGCKLVTIPKFGSHIFQQVLEHHKPTLAYLVPPIVLLLLNNPQILPEHIAHLRTIMSGAAPLGAVDIEKLHKKSNGKVNLLQGYGLTETSPTTHQQTDVVRNGAKFGGCGFLLPNTEAKIVHPGDESKMGLGAHETGELYVRGPQVMKGYHNNHKATEDVLDSDGWFRTGDIAHYDEDEHFFITDRLKELIKVKGFQVAPAELEELLRDHPGVEDAAVIGVPHAEFGEVPKAFVVPNKGTTINLEKVHEYIGNKVAKYKQLAGGIVTVESIPKSPAGKILRRQLKDM